MSRFDDKVAVVTGGASGIGLEIARRFLAEGARVALLDVQEDALTQAAESLPGDRTLTHRTDVSKKADVVAAAEAVKERFGGADVLVNSAGVERAGDFLEYAEEDFDFTLDVNVKGVFLTSQAFARQMVGRGGGAIVNIASTASHVGIPALVAYTASKGGVLQLTRSTAMALVDQNVRVNCVSPGYTNTPMGNAWAHVAGIPMDRFKRRAALANPIGRGGEPEDIAKAVLFLASEDASYTTGTNLAVDGGLLASEPFMHWPGRDLSYD